MLNLTIEILFSEAKVSRIYLTGHVHIKLSTSIGASTVPGYCHNKKRMPFCPNLL